MGRRRIKLRRQRAEQRWPLLANMMVCHFNQDFDVLYGSLDGALAAAARDGSTEHRRAILKELRDWNATDGLIEDIRPLLEHDFWVDLLFKSPTDARRFMNLIYDELLAGVKSDTR